MDEQASSQQALVVLACEIVAAYVSKNSLQPGDLPELIRSVHTALASAAEPKAAEAEPEKPTPAISVRKSVTPDHIISLETGKPFKSLKRHLGALGLTPAQYREKWGLPKDYPMVAASYAAQRSQLAKSFGLGRKAETAAAPAPKAEAPAVPRKRGRKAA